MGRIEKNKRLLIERKNKQVLGKPEMDCPEATQDLKLNTKNRDAAIKENHIQYGPLNVDEPPGAITYVGLNAFAPPAPTITDNGPDAIDIAG